MADLKRTAYCIRTDTGRLLFETVGNSVTDCLKRWMDRPNRALWSWYVRAGYRIVHVKIDLTVIAGSEFPATDELHEYEFKPTDRHDGGAELPG